MPVQGSDSGDLSAVARRLTADQITIGDDGSERTVRENGHATTCAGSEPITGELGSVPAMRSRNDLTEGPVVRTLLGMGATSVVAQTIGSGDHEKAQRVTTHALVLAAVTVAALALAGLLTIGPVFRMIGAGDEVLPIPHRLRYDGDPPLRRLRVQRGRPAPLLRRHQHSAHRRAARAALLPGRTLARPAGTVLGPRRDGHLRGLPGSALVAVVLQDVGGCPASVSRAARASVEVHRKEDVAEVEDRTPLLPFVGDVGDARDGPAVEDVGDPHCDGAVSLCTISPESTLSSQAARCAP